MNQVKDPQLKQSAISAFELTKRVAATTVTMRQKMPMNGVTIWWSSVKTPKTVKIAHAPASNAGAPGAESPGNHRVGNRIANSTNSVVRCFGS
jgi:hypothetical protein